MSYKTNKYKYSFERMYFAMLYNKHDALDIMKISQDDAMLVAEAALCDVLSNAELAELTEAADVCRELVEMGVVTEKSIVRLDKKAKISRAYKTAIFTIAREKKDPLFKKLVTTWRIERTLEAKLMKKYHTEAMKRAKVSVAKLGSGKKDTKNKVVSKAVSAAKAQFNAK